MTSFQDINLVIAHGLEARVILDYFSLELVEDKEFKIYKNQAGMQAIVSGMGVENASAATTVLGKRDLEQGLGEKLRAWLNIGIAGHPEAGLGSCFYASKIVNRSSGEAQFPAPILTGLTSATVVTVDEPEVDYPESVLYEMEASGFWRAAIEFTSLEFVQCLKIVSDNKELSTENVTKQVVLDLMRDNIEAIQGCCSQLQSFVSDYNQTYGLEAFYVESMQSCLDSYHFTVTQRIQLKRLIQRYSALDLSPELRKILSKTFNSSNDLINELSEGLSLQ
jgi:adenosylhomocysteine nucleosidase